MQKPDLSKYERVPPSHIITPVSAPDPMPWNQSGQRNPYLRCPTPQALTTAQDSLNQYYQSGIPQYRIIPPRTGTGQ